MCGGRPRVTLDLGCNNVVVMVVVQGVGGVRQGCERTQLEWLMLV